MVFLLKSSPFPAAQAHGNSAHPPASPRSKQLGRTLLRPCSAPAQAAHVQMKPGPAKTLAVEAAHVQMKPVSPSCFSISPSWPNPIRLAHAHAPSLWSSCPF